jgi:hypothetical protein
MRAAAAAAAALAGLLIPAGTTAPPKPKPISPITIRPIGTATASAAPAKAGARPAQLTVTLRLELQCGRPGSLPIIVVLPAAERVPATLSRNDVRVNGVSPVSVSLSHHVVGVMLPRTSGVVTCNSMAPGTLTVVFLRTAGFGNPVSPGRYRVSIRSGVTSAVAQLLVS